MDASPPERARSRAGFINRRGLLWFAGAGGLGAAAASLSSKWAGIGRPGHLTAPSETVTAADLALPASPPVAALPLTVPPAQASGVMLCRDAWHAQPARPGGVVHKLSQMTIHHTGVVLGDNRKAPGRLLQHQKLHQGERGWVDIAYHVGVDRNGNIYELRQPDLVGDTATEYDPTGHFLVLCEGDFDQEAVSEDQLHGAAMAFAWAAQRFSITTDVLRGHKDFAATACPGANLYSHITSGALKRRVDDLLAAGRVDLAMICGPEAAERVAAIEAGQ